MSNTKVFSLRRALKWVVIVAALPIISSFYGITIHMYWSDHLPAHFHARCGGFAAAIAIDNLKVIGGDLPAVARRLTLEWAAEHRAALLENWELCARHHPPKRIPP